MINNKNITEEFNSPIIQLNIQNFRNITNLKFNPGANLNIIYGDNARGKTNLIEAIWIFTGHKSFRGAKESQLIMNGINTAKLEMKFFLESRIQYSTIKFIPQKEIYLNHVKIDKLTEYVGIFSTVIFSPEDLSLVKGGPGKRRYFLDIALSQIKSKYSRLMIEYNKVLSHRNALLKDIVRFPTLIDTIDVWDETLASLMAHITRYRLRYIEVLVPIITDIYSHISKKREILSITYTGEKFLSSAMSFEELKGYYISKLKDTRRMDMKQGYTQVGPHRDDFDICINNLNAKNFASQGQQRSIVLSVKLAEAEALRLLVNKNPIILLDDVMSELDIHRRNYVVEKLKDYQCFITCCEKEYFNLGLCKTDYYKIDELLNNNL